MSASRNWMKWALVGSVGLNLAFAGLIAGALAKGPSPAPWPGIALLQYARALPEPFREDLGHALRNKGPAWKGPLEALRGQREALAVALTAEPYAPETVSALLARETALTNELSNRGAALLLEQIGRMTPDERAAYARTLRELPHHGPRRRAGD